jgi:hypothetical protein
MITHITYAVSADRIRDEVDFWNALGFHRLHSHATLDKLWLSDGQHAFIHLVEVGRFQREPNPITHVAIIPSDWTATMRRLEKLPQVIRAEEASQHWGAKRVFIWSPTDFCVELVEHPPPSRWSGPPPDD